MPQYDMPVDVSAEQARLIVIDMQKIFQEPSSQWRVPGYAQAATQVARLTAQFGRNTIWTRFVRDPQEHGSWVDYFDRWSACRYEADSPVWGFTGEVPVDGVVISAPTFSKWGAELEAATQAAECLVISGVATDCCVLSTVLGAVDAGKKVIVVADACAGITPAAHQQALDLMHLLSPMVTITQTLHLLGR